MPRPGPPASPPPALLDTSGDHTAGDGPAVDMPATAAAAAPGAAGPAASASAGGTFMDDSVAALMAEEAATFASSHTARCMRDRLRRVGESASLDAAQRGELREAEQRLADRVAALDAMRAMAAVDGGNCRVRVSDDATRLLVDVANPSDLPLGDGWCLVATMLREQAARAVRGARGGPGEAPATSDACASTCTPLMGLPAKGRWRLEIALPSDAAASFPLRLHLFVAYRAASVSPSSAGAARADAAAATAAAAEAAAVGGFAGVGGEGDAPRTACMLVHACILRAPDLLRRRALWPPEDGNAEASLMQRVRAVLDRGDGNGGGGGDATGSGGLRSGAAGGATAEADRRTGSDGGAPGHLMTSVAVTAEQATHCKLRLRPVAPASGGPAAGSTTGAGRTAADWLKKLLQGSAFLCREAASGGGSSGVSGSGPRQASAQAELPDGRLVSLRLHLEEAAPPGTGPETILLLLQCDDPRALWALRGALLAQLAASDIPLQPTAAAATAEAAAAAEGSGASPLLAPEEGAASDDEALARLPALRRWQLAHVQMHEQVQRCFELRRRFDSGAPSVSLQEPSRRGAPRPATPRDASRATRAAWV